MQPKKIDTSCDLRFTESMFVMTVDQVDSRAHADAVPALLATLQGVPVRLPFERTAGDEVQAVLEDPRAVVDAWEAIVRDGRWRVGIGIGHDVELADSSRASRGGPFLGARDAVDEAKGHPDRVAVRVSPSVDDASQSSQSSQSESRGSDASAAARDAQTVLRLLSIVIDERTDAGWRVIDAARAAPDATQAQLADQLGITRQAVSKALRTHDAVTVDEGLRTAARLLARTLELCPTGASMTAATTRGAEEEL